MRPTMRAADWAVSAAFELGSERRHFSVSLVVPRGDPAESMRDGPQAVGRLTPKARNRNDKKQENHPRCFDYYGVVICIAGFLFIGSKVLSRGVVDCGWDDTSLAWIDENQNRAWENNEKPLAGVKFVVDDILHNYDTSGEAISNANGKAGVYVFPVDCNGFDEIKIIIKAIPPDGYKPTTPSEISVPNDAAKNAQNDNFLFGFIQKDQ